ncbi:MAG TPA: substrate-binding domain-containing protein [Bryobacteraceae bacterium]|nr:substrate-binding domain-containing protein [Bryobacteraceae bacterium]
MKHERVLIVLLLVEIAIFSFIGQNFLTAANSFEIVRLSVELGLLALSLTPVIVTGGIDLSVGSMMGLAAVLFGKLWRDFGWPIELAALVALLTGLAGGGLNALLITRWSIPPLIVTLGSYSLFRGLAEGITGGVDNFTGFPARFLYLGQGYIGGVIPPQTLMLAAAAIGYHLLLQRSVIGRALYAIGFSAAGARYAGLPVQRRVSLVYLLCGLASSLAAVLYVAHLGQAKADAGTGYELAAITAVVLGGTSIFGGRGTIAGTMLGLAAIVVLQNGLRLAALPAELTGILTGALLLITLAADQLIARRRWQMAVALVLLLAVAGGWWLVAGRATQVHRITVGMMPKAKGDPYFVSCLKGAEAAARELNVNLIWDGPTDLDPAKQNEVVEGWITRGVDVIAVSVENQAAISTVLRKARAKGIRVITWDADSLPDARDFLINQGTAQDIGYTLADETARILGGSGEFAIITASLSAANQNQWIGFIKQRVAEKHPGLKLVTIRPSDGDRDRAFSETQTVLKVYPNVKVIMAIAAPAVPGAAEAVKQSDRTDVKVTGLSLPNMCKPYVHSGAIESIVLWNTTDLGYLTVYAAEALGKNTLKRGDTGLKAGRLGMVKVNGDQVLLGAPFIFNKTNIDNFNF